MKKLFCFICLLLYFSVFLLAGTPAEHYQLISSLYKINSLPLALTQIQNHQQDFPNSSYLDKINFIEARIYQELNQYNQAIDSYHRFLIQYPLTDFTDKASFYLGQTYYFAGKYLFAREQFQNFLSKFPKSDFRKLAIFWLAESSYQLKDYTNSIRNYQAYLADSPKLYEKESNLGLSWSYSQNGQYDLAINILEKFLLKSTENASEGFFKIKHQLALLYFKKQRYPQAILIFQEIIDSNYPNNFRDSSYYYLAESYYQISDYDKAIISCKKALADSSKSEFSFQVTYTLIWSLLSKNDYQQAKNYVNILRPQVQGLTYKESLDYLEALIEEKLSQTNKASQLYLNILNQKEHAYLQQSLLGLIRINYDKKNIVQTIELSNKYFNQYPNGKFNDIILIYLGEIFYLNKDYLKAESYFQQLLNTQSNSSFYIDALFKSILCQIKLQKKDQAISNLEKIIKNYPLSQYDSQANYFLAELYYDKNIYTKAKEHYLIALSKTKDPLLKGKITFGLAWISFQDQNFTKAAEYFSDYSNQYPSSNYQEEALFKKAESILNLRQYNTAKDLFQNFQQRYQQSKYYNQASWNRAFADYKLNNFQGAANQFSLLAEKLASEPSSNLNLLDNSLYWQAWSYFRDKTYQKALDIFIKISKNSLFSWESIAKSYLKQGDCLYNMGKYLEASKAYQQVLTKENTAISPLSKEALYGLFLSKMELGEYVKDIYEIFKQQFPNDPLIQDMKERLED